MKKIISIILIFILFFPFWFTFTLYQIEKRAIKKSVKKMLIEKIDKSELVLLKFKTEEINSKIEWEHSKEFKYHNKMYDIVETIFWGDSVVFHCWLDDEETQLNKTLFNLLTSSLEKNNKSNKIFNQLNSFNSIFYINQIIESNNIFLNIFIRIFGNYLNKFSYYFICPLSPPPK